MKNRIYKRDIPRYISFRFRDNRLQVFFKPPDLPDFAEFGWIKRFWYRYVLSKALNLLNRYFYEKIKRDFKPHPLSNYHIDEGFKIWKKITLY